MIPHFLRRLNRTGLLALCNLALVLLLVYELAASPAVSPRAAATPRTAPAAAAPAPPTFAMPPIRQYREVLDRPLFSRSRRPNLGAEDGAEPVTSLTLIGIIISPGNRLALLEYGSPPKLVRVGVGQAIAGWTISQIEPEAVLVRQGDTVARVKPRDLPPNGAEQVAPVAASAPAGPPNSFGSLRRAIGQGHSDGDGR